MGDTQDNGLGSSAKKKTKIIMKSTTSSGIKNPMSSLHGNLPQTPGNQLGYIKYKFDWRNFKEKRVRVITAQFLFRYEPSLNKFKINNDANRYTVSELAWNFLPEFKTYNFILRDIKIIDLVNGKEKPLDQESEYVFDVSVDGDYVSRILF